MNQTAHPFAGWLVVVVLVTSTLSGYSEKTVKPSKENRSTLASAFDSIGFASFQLPEEDYFLSCFALEEVLQRKLPELEIVDARHLAKELRVVVATGRLGRLGFRVDGAISLRATCEAFAKLWDVTLLIDGSTVMVIEPFDVDRFPHDLVIRAKK
jgi:hypothetical protein